MGKSSFSDTNSLHCSNASTYCLDINLTRREHLFLNQWSICTLLQLTPSLLKTLSLVWTAASSELLHTQLITQMAMSRILQLPNVLINTIQCPGGCNLKNFQFLTTSQINVNASIMQVYNVALQCSNFYNIGIEKLSIKVQLSWLICNFWLQMKKEARMNVIKLKINSRVLYST